MRTPFLAALAVLALVAAGCGGGDDLEVATPSTTPDLTVPSAPAAAESDEAGDDTASTTGTNADEPTSSDTGGTAPDATGGTATPAAPAPTPAAPAPTPDDTGGAAEPAAPAPQEDTGGAEAGGTSDFCAENPGAC